MQAVDSWSCLDKTARVYEAWGKVNQAKDEDLIIQGVVKCRTKGGLIVDVFGLEAFLPGSQVDVKPIRDFDEYVGKQMEFKVVELTNLKRCCISQSTY